MRKVRGDDNVADLFTKHLTSRDRISYLLGLLGCHYLDGRASRAPALRRERQTRLTLHDAMGGAAARPAAGHSEQILVKDAFGMEDEELQSIMDEIGDAPSTPADSCLIMCLITSDFILSFDPVLKMHSSISRTSPTSVSTMTSSNALGTTSRVRLLKTLERMVVDVIPKLCTNRVLVLHV